MKIITILIFATFMQVSAGGFAQRITLNHKLTTLKKVFNEVNKQTGYNILWSARKVKNMQVADVHFENAPLREVLDKCLHDFSLTYTIENKLIVIREKEKNLIETITDYLNAVQITGKITDQNGRGLIGASVIVKGTNISATADANGQYQIKVPGNDAVLVFKYVGFLSKEINVDGKTNINVQLMEDEQALGEVAVVGYGTVKKVNLTGSLSILDMSTKKNRPLTNASQALQGVSGLWVNQTGGKPGQDVASIRIRGVGTTNNSNPLVLVDGVEYNINEINPAFIDNITVLKDASAAIYGSRAANGVILITTKEGKSGQSKIDYSFSHGIQTPSILPDVVWDPILYMDMRNQALINEGKPITYTQAQIEEYRNGMSTNPYAYPNINWFDYVMKDGYIQQHNLQFSGGTDKTRYNLSLGYMDQDGILIGANHANRYSMALNLSTQITNNLKIGGNIIGNYRKYNENAYGTNYFFNRLMRVLPIFTPYLEDGRYGNVVFATPGRGGMENPAMLINEGKGDHVAQRILTKVYADYKLPFNLSYNVNLGLDKLDGYARTFIPFLTTYHPLTEAPYEYNNNAYSDNYNDNNLNLTFYHTLNWSKKLNQHHDVSAMIGSSYSDFDNSYFSARVEGYFDNTLTDISVGSINPSNAGKVTRDRLLSYFGRANYSFKEKYLLDLSFRYDGSSRFARGNRWGFFPAVSTAWRIDKDLRLETYHVNLLKLRASWGKLGNQSVPLYSYSNSVDLGEDYSFNSIITPGAAVKRYNDPTISWETTTTYNAGLDVEVLEGKVGMLMDVFKKRTSGILRQVSLPGQMGNLGGPQKNIGTVDNNGYEFNLFYRNTIGRFGYQVSGGITHVNNKVVDLNGETVISGRRILKEGYPIDSYYMYKAEGVYQNQEQIDYSATVSGNVKPGFLKYTDVNEDGKINGEDRIITGNSIPKNMYNFSTKFNFKGIELMAAFQGVQGINIYPASNLAWPINNGAGITKEWVTDSWTVDRPQARLPILVTPQGAPENYEHSTFWLQDASYLRLQNLQLSYDLPVQLIGKLSLRNCRIFANAENLFTFSAYKQFDPEKEIKQDDLYSYPMLKTFSFGLNVTF